MELNIYHQEGKLKAAISPADSSSLSEGIMTDSILSLSFVLFDCVPLDVNDYVDLLGKRYWMLEAYTPNQKSTIEWSYNVKFYAIEGVFRRALCLKTVDNELNPVFSLTAPAIEHVRLIVANINRVMSTTDWKVGEVEATANLTIDYNSIYCHAALSSIATAAETEWWIDGLTVNLCRCEHGELLSLGYGNGLQTITLDTNENAKFFTRLFPLGSTRNIDPAVYGSTRLHLPDGQKYVEQNTRYGIIEHSEEPAFSGIYPRRTGVVGAVRKETKKSEDGKPFDIYYFTDPAIDFDPNKYEIGGLVKGIVFETGDLAGRDFEVNYNTEKKEFEVITQWPYGDDMQLPGVLVMKPGNEYILYNITMPTEYYPKAEQELATAVEAYMQKNKRDKSVYKAPTDYIDLNERGITLTVGQRIHLVSSKYFPIVGYRDSRITKITRKVNEPLQADIEISDLPDIGGKAVITQGISDAKHYAQAAMAGVPDMIRSYENTPASDSNLYTAKKSIQSFVSRLLDDVVAGMITFLKGIKIGRFVSGAAGGRGAYIDERGYAEMQGLKLNEFLEVPELRFNRIDVVSGELWNSVAFGLIESVDTANKIAKLKLESGELRDIHSDDFCRGLFHSLAGNAITAKTDECGFSTLPGFSTAYFTPTELLPDGASFKYDLKPGTSIHPCKAMKFAVYGNATDANRQASAYSTRTYKRYLINVNTWEIDLDRNISAQYGDVEGLTINGHTMHGTGSYQSNGYFAGYIRFTPEQKEELKGEDGKDAHLPDWLQPWDDNKTMIDGEWVASPKMFSGTRNPDTGKLTGIAQGMDCVTIDGEKRTGIFALVEDRVVFALDPVKKQNLFKGRVEADEGTFSGSINTPYLPISESDAEDISDTIPGLNLSGISNYLLKNQLNITCRLVTITLPESTNYNGKHVSIISHYPGATTRIDYNTYVMVENGGLFGGVSEMVGLSIKRARTVAFFDGILNLSAVLDSDLNKVRWFIDAMPPKAEIRYEE